MLVYTKDTDNDKNTYHLLSPEILPSLAKATAWNRRKPPGASMAALLSGSSPGILGLTLL